MRFIASAWVEKASNGLAAFGSSDHSVRLTSGPSLSRSWIALVSTALPAPLRSLSTGTFQSTDQLVPVSIQIADSFLIAMPILKLSLPLKVVIRPGPSLTGMLNSGVSLGVPRCVALAGLVSSFSSAIVPGFQ